MNVLVTGANGFIGRHAVAALRAAGHRVRSSSRRPPTGSDPTEWINIEVGPTTDWSEALDGIDAVVHAAAVVHTPGATADLHERVTRLGTGALADQAAGRVDRFVLLSTVAVFGDPPPERIDHSNRPAPATPYGAAKLGAEDLVSAACRGTSTAATVLRLPAVYGAGDPGNVGRLIRLVLRRAPLPFGGVDNRRSFLSVGSAADAVVAAVEHGPVGAYLAADEEVVSTPDLIRLIGRLGGVRPRVVTVPSSLLRSVAALGSALGRIARRPVPIDRAALQRLTGSMVIDASMFKQATGWRPEPLQKEMAAAVASAQERLS